LAQFYNANKAPSKPHAEPSKFHPFTKKPKPKQATPEEIARLLSPDWHKHI
jgi:hypothetical protein